MYQYRKLGKIISLLLICAYFLGCNEQPSRDTEISFDNPFPKRTKNLTWTLGDAFSIKAGNDTLDFRVTFQKSDRYNFIIGQPTQDTIFAGTVCNYRGLYYFNQQLNDTTYRIYAVRINNESIQGLGTINEQMRRLYYKYKDLITGKEKAPLPMVRSVDQLSGHIRFRLTPDKREMRKFYESIIDSFPVHQLVNWIEPTQDIEIEKEITDLSETHHDELEIISKIYPNPASDNCTLELRENGNYKFGIFDVSGRLISNGQLTERVTNLDLSNIQSGTYFIRVYSVDKDERETAKLVIEK